MTDYSGSELDQLEDAAYEVGRKAGIKEAAEYIRTWYTDPNCRSMANGILALIDRPSASASGKSQSGL